MSEGVSSPGGDRTGSWPLGSRPLGSRPLGSRPLGSRPLGSRPLGSRLERSLPLFLLFVLGAALLFQGTRGLWEPDEGRYAHAAWEMLRTGDWLVPHLHGLAYLDKPPVVYWATAAGLALLGPGAWGARLGCGIALALTAWVVGAWAARRWGTAFGRRAGAAYVVTLLPFTAGNTLTPDIFLTLFTTTTAFAWWCFRDELPRSGSPGEASARWRWALLAGLALGLGIATKGPAALVFLAPIGLFALLQRELVAHLRRPEVWVAGVVAALLGGAWYAVLAMRLPGASEYFFDNQVAGRLWGGQYDRHGGPWGWLEVYGPALVAGALPWSVSWPGMAFRASRERLRSALGDPLKRFLGLFVLVPLVVLCVASSRLPLYLLPVMPAVVLLTLRAIPERRVDRVWRTTLVLAVVLVALRGVAGVVPSHRDASALAERLKEAGVAPTDCLDTLSMRAHGLSLEGLERITWHGIWPETYPYFERPGVLAEEIGPLLESCDGRLWVLSEIKRREAAEIHLPQASLTCERLTLDDRRDLYRCRATRPGALDPGVAVP